MALYVKLYCEALTDPKFLKAGNDGFAIYCRGLLYSKIHMTDGFVPTESLRLIAGDVRNPSAVAALLVSLNLWEKVDGGWTVGEGRWADRQVSKADISRKRRENRERQQRYRERVSRERNAVTDSVTNGATDSVTGRATNTFLTQPDHRPQTTDHIEKKSKPKEKFRKPTVEEIAAYCSERKNSVDAQRFFDHYEANGWRVGKNPMRDWHASVRTWERNERPPPASRVATAEDLLNYNPNG